MLGTEAFGKVIVTSEYKIDKGDVFMVNKYRVPF
jgi:hypothetical protein